MNEPADPSDDPYTRTKLRRRRAQRLMRAVIVICVLVAIAIGADQLYSGGWQAFLHRPPGVGATPAEPTAADTAAPTRAVP